MNESYYNMQQNSVENATELELDIIKSEMHERSRQAGTIEFIGTLSGETTSEYWTGAISLQKRLDSSEISPSELQDSLHYLSDCYVLTQRGASVGCIDGRFLNGYNDNNPVTFGRKLGPKTPGGTAIDGVADRVALSAKGESFDRVTIKNDISTMAEAALKTGYQAGDHVAANCPDGKCGCGAVDGVIKHCETVTLPASAEVKAITKSLLGASYNEATFDEVSDSINVLLSHEDDYLVAKDEIIAELVAINPDAAPVLIGTHNEVAVMLNMVHGETLHEDHYAARTDGKIQAFNYDVWHTLDIAKERYPEDETQQNRFVHARIALAVTALMDLTDGSLLLGVRTASQNS